MTKISYVLLTSDYCIFIHSVHPLEKRADGTVFSLKKQERKEDVFNEVFTTLWKNDIVNIFAYDVKLIFEQLREFVFIHGFRVTLEFSIPLKACLYNFLGVEDRHLFFNRHLWLFATPPICHGAWNKNIQVKQTHKRWSKRKTMFHVPELSEDLRRIEKI